MQPDHPRLFVALAAFALLVLAFGVIAYLAARSRELFVLRVRAGRTTLQRGRVPPSLLEALGDVMQRAGVERATLRVLKSDGRARVVASGLSEPVLQRARNVVGTYPLQKLLGAQLRAKR
jgi:hypothetical protein